MHETTSVKLKVLERSKKVNSQDFNNELILTSFDFRAELSKGQYFVVRQFTTFLLSFNMHEDYFLVIY